MSALLQIAGAGTASLGFAVIFAVPRCRLGRAALAGGIGWAIFLAASPAVGPYLATFFAAVAVGCFQTPEIVRPGIVPLVPGTIIYLAMLALAEGRFTAAADLGAQTAGYALAVSLGQRTAAWMRCLSRP